MAVLVGIEVRYLLGSRVERGPFISRETFEVLKVRFEPLSDYEKRIEVLVDPSLALSNSIM